MDDRERLPQVPGRTVNWRGLQLLLFVAVALGLAGYQMLGANQVRGQELDPLGIEPHGIRIVKYASPADGTDFLFSCEGAGCPEASFSVEDTVAGSIETTQYYDIVSPTTGVPYTITENLTGPQLAAGWRVYKIECFGYSGQYWSVELDARQVSESYYNPNDQSRIPGANCAFYNALPSTITVVKDEALGLGTDYAFSYVFTSTPGAFTLDDAVPDDSDSVVATKVFPDLNPGEYSFVELDGVDLESINCTVNGAPANYVDFGIGAARVPITGGLLYSDTGPVLLQNFDDCGSYVSSSPGSSEQRPVLYFDLTSLPVPISGARLRFYVNYAYNGGENGEPVTTTLYGYAGDGAITPADWDVGLPLGTLAVSQDNEYVVDVGAFVLDLIDDAENFAEFRFEITDKSFYQSVGFDCNRYVLELLTPWGTIVELNGGEDVVCTFKNVPKFSFITVNKVVVGGAPSEDWKFDFDYMPGITHTFNVPASGGSEEISTDISGTVKITETPVSGYMTQSRCSNGATGGTTISPNIPFGSDITCTFTNTKLSTIVLDKVTSVPSSEDFTLNVSGGPDNVNINSSVANLDAPLALTNLKPGTYNVTEAAKSGWNPGTTTCTGGGNGLGLVLAPGATITCIFNNLEGRRIVVDKVTTVASDQAFAFNVNGGPFGVDTDFSQASGDPVYTSPALNAGTYSVVEDPAFLWQRTSASCTNGASTFGPANFTLGSSGNVTCTSTSRPLTLTLDVKVTVGALGAAPTCPATSGPITVTVNSVVEYCVTVTNTGEYTFDVHSLAMSGFPSLLDEASYLLGPGASVNTVALGLSITETVVVSTSHVATWTAGISGNGVSVAAQDAVDNTVAQTVAATTVVVNVVGPSGPSGKRIYLPNINAGP